MQKVNYYAGIGSRDVPQDVYREMSVLASRLENIGYWLRSGNAQGCDQAFASGVKTKAQIFLPWSSFEREFQLTRPNHQYIVDDLQQDREAYESIAIYHPSKDIKLPTTTRQFMARNYRQVIGRTDEPDSKFVLCWTPAGKTVGGTGQAIRIARDKKIPVINFANFNDGFAVMEYLQIWNLL